MWIPLLLVIAADAFTVEKAQESGKAGLLEVYERAEAICPCTTVRICPNYYGSSPLDILNYGNFPPCTTYGRVRCCSPTSSDLSGDKLQSSSQFHISSAHPGLKASFGAFGDIFKKAPQQPTNTDDTNSNTDSSNLREVVSRMNVSQATDQKSTIRPNIHLTASQSNLDNASGINRSTNFKDAVPIVSENPSSLQKENPKVDLPISTTDENFTGDQLIQPGKPEHNTVNLPAQFGSKITSNPSIVIHNEPSSPESKFSFQTHGSIDDTFAESHNSYVPLSSYEHASSDTNSFNTGFSSNSETPLLSKSEDSPLSTSDSYFISEFESTNLGNGRNNNTMTYNVDNKYTTDFVDYTGSFSHIKLMNNSFVKADSSTLSNIGNRVNNASNLNYGDKLRVDTINKNTFASRNRTSNNVIQEESFIRNPISQSETNQHNTILLTDNPNSSPISNSGNKLVLDNEAAVNRDDVIISNFGGNVPMEDGKAKDERDDSNLDHTLKEPTQGLSKSNIHLPSPSFISKTVPSVFSVKNEPAHIENQQQSNSSVINTPGNTQNTKLTPGITIQSNANKIKYDDTGSEIITKDATETIVISENWDPHRISTSFHSKPNDQLRSQNISGLPWNFLRPLTVRPKVINNIETLVESNTFEVSTITSHQKGNHMNNIMETANNRPDDIYSIQDDIGSFSYFEPTKLLNISSVNDARLEANLHEKQNASVVFESPLTTGFGEPLLQTNTGNENEIPPFSSNFTDLYSKQESKNILSTQDNGHDIHFSPTNEKDIQNLPLSDQENLTTSSTDEIAFSSQNTSPHEDRLIPLEQRKSTETPSDKFFDANFPSNSNTHVTKTTTFDMPSPSPSSSAHEKYDFNNNILLQPNPYYALRSPPDYADWVPTNPNYLPDVFSYYQPVRPLLPSENSLPLPQFYRPFLTYSSPSNPIPLPPSFFSSSSLSSASTPHSSSQLLPLHSQTTAHDREDVIHKTKSDSGHTISKFFTTPSLKPLLGASLKQSLTSISESSSEILLNQSFRPVSETSLTQPLTPLSEILPNQSLTPVSATLQIQPLTPDSEILRKPSLIPVSATLQTQPLKPVSGTSLVQTLTPISKTPQILSVTPVSEATLTQSMTPASGTSITQVNSSPGAANPEVLAFLAGIAPLALQNERLHEIIPVSQPSCLAIPECYRRYGDHPLDYCVYGFLPFCLGGYVRCLDNYIGPTNITCIEDLIFHTTNSLSQGINLLLAGLERGGGANSIRELFPGSFYASSKPINYTEAEEGNTEPRRTINARCAKINLCNHRYGSSTEHVTVYGFLPQCPKGEVRCLDGPSFIAPNEKNFQNTQRPTTGDPHSLYLV